jgi:hypothetical protein
LLNLSEFSLSRSHERHATACGHNIRFRILLIRFSVRLAAHVQPNHNEFELVDSFVIHFLYSIFKRIAFASNRLR